MPADPVGPGDGLVRAFALLLDESTSLDRRLAILAARIPDLFRAPPLAWAEIRLGDTHYPRPAGRNGAPAVEVPLSLGPDASGSIVVMTEDGPGHAGVVLPDLPALELLARVISTVVRESLAEQLLLRRERESRQQIEDRSRLELELLQAQRLEAVGQLAAGIAHEINTPIQFIGDSLAFTQDAIRALVRLHPVHVELVERCLAASDPLPTAGHAAAIAEEEDVGYLLEQMPAVLQRARDGVERVTRIVRAMKGFAHPATGEMVRVDLAHAIETTITVAWHEIKYVADVERLFADVPPVRCHPGDVNQIVLNLLVNAAHAIGDVVGDTGTRGRITVRTWLDDRWAVLSISDTGSGIPPEIRGRIFEQFFTTKEVGRGTGQGLAIVRGLVIERHGGSIDVESEPGAGTTFHVRLPIDGPAGGGGA